MQNKANGHPKISRPKAQRYAAWLVRPSSENGGGLTYAQVGRIIGRSAGWVHHVAHGNWSAAHLTPEAARIIGAVYEMERSRWRERIAQVAAVQELLVAAGDVVTRIEKLSRSIVRS